MSALVIKQHDTFPPLEATLTDQNGPINLTEATEVKFIAKLEGGAPVIEGTCAVTKPAEGIVTYTWATEDTKTVGKYKVEFKIKWKAGGIESVPNSGTDEIEIQESI